MKPIIPWHIMCKLACRAMITGQDLNDLIRMTRRVQK
jgi:hypothetical protein